MRASHPLFVVANCNQAKVYNATPIASPFNQVHTHWLLNCINIDHLNRTRRNHPLINIDSKLHILSHPIRKRCDEFASSDSTWIRMWMPMNCVVRLLFMPPVAQSQSRVPPYIDSNGQVETFRMLFHRDGSFNSTLTSDTRAYCCDCFQAALGLHSTLSVITRSTQRLNSLNGLVCWPHQLGYWV